VVLAFIDSRCTTVCPLTAAILHTALARLGGASAHVSLVAVNANPTATRVADVYHFSAEHEMLHTWTYLTGPPAELRAIYHAYQVYVCVTHSGRVIHDAAVYVIDPSGRERLYYDMMDAGGQFTLSSETTALVAGMRAWLPGAPQSAPDSARA
jgi:cytochrome oxidase Cu insertion factor (SCO1/SenC/PrrC family)